MRSRLPSWVLLLYLAIDLANPFVPGAFQFTSDQGLVWVEALSHVREEVSDRASEASASAPTLFPPLLAGECRGSPQSVPAGHLTAWLVRVRTGDPPARDLPPSDSDDH